MRLNGIIQLYPQHESATYSKTLYYTKMIQRHILLTNPQHVTQRHVLPSTEWYLPTARFLSFCELPMRTSHRRRPIVTTGWSVALSPTFCSLMAEGITSFLKSVINVRIKINVQKVKKEWIHQLLIWWKVERVERVPVFYIQNRLWGEKRELCTQQSRR